MQGGWSGEGSLVRRNSGRGGTGLRNVIRPGDEERMTDIANVANTKLHGEEQSSNIPPWVVNVSKVKQVISYIRPPQLYFPQ